MIIRKNTSLIDSPRRADQKDLFGIDKYKDALVQFVDETNTPITIAIQGEWGSGKTSLMNILKDTLCDQDGAKHYAIWVNTWHYSLMKSEEETLIAIIGGLANKITEIATEKDSSLDKLAKKSLGILSRIAKSSAKVAIKASTGQDLDQVVDAFSSDNNGSSILELRNSLNELLGKVLDQSEKKGFIFFIDDLDRIDPPVAVNILELLKNIFDLDNCVFLLAIDYDVVVKGLEPKFGKLTDKNEREFRSFFDKIIQLPFSMPVTTYSIDTFLKKSLEDIGYIDPDQKDTLKFFENLTSIAYNSVGTNPRSLKRLINTMSLISIINQQTGSDKEYSDLDKQVNFALVCLQVSYPRIYKAINEDPDFVSWDDDTATRLKLRKFEEQELEKLKTSEEFDEEWEQVLFRICEADSYLERRAFNISSLLNKVYEIASMVEDLELGDYIGNLLELSSVTDVQAFDKPRAVSNRAAAAENILQSLGDLIPQKLRGDVTGFNLPAVTVNLNRRLGLRPLIKNITEVQWWIGLLISPKGANINLSINTNLPVLYEQQFIDDGPDENLNTVIDSNQAYLTQVNNDLEAIAEKLNANNSKKVQNCVSVSKNKKFYRCAMDIKKVYSAAEDIYNPTEYEKIAEALVEIALVVSNAQHWVSGDVTEYKSIFE